ncbi:MAG: pseudouridine synthase [Candidatus Kapabacteria bacterium]|nr:pseudouridine synthase [Candidatus Kapabacteria bacterium]
MIIALNKPYGVLSQFTPEPGSSHTTLQQFGLPPDVYPIGRLDADSEGLLLLSDEKGLVSRLLEPINAHERTYWVQIEGIPSEDALALLTNGVAIQDYTTLPSSVKLLVPDPDIWERNPPIRQRASIPTSWLELTLVEGKNRQVRRMTAKVGHPTLRLIRVRSGGLDLADLHIGSGFWRALDTRERALLLQGR